MTQKITSRPDHADSIEELGGKPPSVQYTLFFDDIETILNSLVGDALNLSGFSYTVATVPDASTLPNSLIFVTDETGGAVPAFSRGSDWRQGSRSRRP